MIVVEPPYLIRRAQDLHKKGLFDDAETMYRRLLAFQPAHAAAWHYLGIIYSQTSRGQSALRFINRSIDLDRYGASYFLNRALVYERNGVLGLARSDFKAALRLNPSLKDAYLGLADLSRHAHEYLEASLLYSQAIAIMPSCAKTWMNLGAAHDSEKRFCTALHCYRKASIADPDWPDPELNAALCNLVQGNFEIGWVQYESRWRVKSLLEASDMSKPIVSSRPSFKQGMSSGSVLLWAEQGVGDEIMFGSLISDFSKLGNKLIVQCDKRLRNLFERSMPKIRFINRTTVVPETEYDYQLPLGSLPKLLRPTIDSFSNHRGTYLVADPKRVSVIKSCRSSEVLVRIGISWSSARGEARCIPLHDLLSSIFIPRAEFICLQYGEVEDHIERAERITGIRVTQSPNIDVTNDFEGLAALIESCDLVVTVGNATAHLVGALGKSGVVLLPFHPGWRWLASGESSPWYPSLRLLRQTERADWIPVLKQLRILILTMIGSMYPTLGSPSKQNSV